MIACPRHGIVDVAKDVPCPDCGVAAYDLDDRRARDVVRQNREMAFKTRKIVGGTGAFIAVYLASGVGFAIENGKFEINLIPFLAGGIAAAFAARPLALKMETNPKLRALDAELERIKV